MSNKSHTHARPHASTYSRINAHTNNNAHTQRRHADRHARTHAHTRACTRHDRYSIRYRGLLPISERPIITLPHTNPHYINFLSMTTTLSNVMFSCSIDMLIIQNNRRGITINLRHNKTSQKTNTLTLISK